MNKELNNKKRLEWVDFLKGFAAIIVILVHFWEICKKKYGYIGDENLLFYSLDSITSVGKLAVAIFFIISGYLTANVFLKKTRKQFIVDRCKRMYPLYWFSLILSLILIGKEPIGKFIINATMFQQFVGVGNIIGASWTLQIDWIFYFICIFLVTLKLYQEKKYINLSYYGLLALSLILATLRFFTGIDFPVAIGILLSLTFIGIMLKRNESENKNEPKYNLKLNIILFIITLFPTVMLAYTDRFNDLLNGCRYYISYILALLIFFACKAKIKKENILSRLGKYSYSLYLLHPTIGVFFLNQLFNVKNINIIENMLISFIGTVICAIISGKYIENIWINASKEKKYTNTIFINGRFLTKKITGVQRYACEVIKKWDKMNLDHEIVVLAPKKGIIQELNLTNVKIKKIGLFKGYLWEQISLPIYILFHNNKAKLLNMCNLAPVLYPSYVVIHDIAFKTCSKHLNWKFVLAYKTITRLNIKRYKHIFTVSEFSKKEIMDNYNIDNSKITVTYSSAEHIKNTIPDETIINKLGLKNKKFIFSIGSKSLHKNHDFIINCAKQNPNELFVISGASNDKIFKEKNEEKIKNLIYTGYITDEELVALYKNCDIFMFPSLYEGFGLPPLEALECGCKNIMLSDIKVFKEIYGDLATYIDLSKTLILDEKKKTFDENSFEIIQNKYSWQKIALIIEKMIIENV